MIIRSFDAARVSATDTTVFSAPASLRLFVEAAGTDTASLTNATDQALVDLLSERIAQFAERASRRPVSRDAK